jgi:hypothetical protein
MRKLLVLMVAVAALASPTMADDFFGDQIYFRGWDRTMWAEWDLWCEDGRADCCGHGGGPFTPGDPAVTNPLPLAPIDYMGRTEVIEVGPDGLMIWLPNFIGGTQKDLFVQVTYWQGFGGPMSEPVELEQIVTPDVGDVLSNTWTQRHEYGDGWVTELWWVFIEPNPTQETLILSSMDPTQTLYIDQVYVDSYCLPEPTSLAMLAVGGVLAIRRRR